MQNRMKHMVLPALLAVVGLSAGCDREPTSATPPQYAAYDSTFANNPNRLFVTVERLGNPLVSEVLLEKREHEAHNVLPPLRDPGHFTDNIVAFITDVAKRDPAYANAVANVLVGTDANPGDKLTVFTNRAPGVTAATAASSNAVGWLTYVLAPNEGYGGRKLMNDDVVDKGLSVIFGGVLGNTNNVSPGLVTDNVRSNDNTALNTFPYLPAPNP